MDGRRLRLIIAGSRTITSYAAVAQAYATTLEKLELPPEGLEIVSGAAMGADAQGELLAVKHDIPLKRFPADWKQHGRAAGPIRNRAMAEYADAAILVWRGDSPGTRSMRKEMDRLGKPVYLYEVKA